MYVIINFFSVLGPKYKKKSHNHQGVITGSMKSGEDVGADGDDAELYSFKVSSDFVP